MNKFSVNVLVSYLRYYGAALVLKFFSLNNLTKKAYRRLGNKFFQEKHSAVATTDVEQGIWLYDLIRIQNKQIGKFLELGTGWTHFYSLFLRYFFDGEIVLFDIQDNRSLGAVKKRMTKLAQILIEDFNGRAAWNKLRIEKIGDVISTTPDFQTLYDKLNMKYVLSPTGSLADFKENEFDVIFSMDVLEHISKNQLNENSPIMYRLLKPGGLFIHQIGLDDHIAHYAPRIPQKNYLRYSEMTWRKTFENTVQFINRLQTSDYLEIF
ncbi:MAG: class I SAM-dependent methyltransferase, partial [Candidatus Aminicenantes bacterium]|nr:class I SAM-dependent methyltransferase [Candidatus Aminicenantes bacterium]